MAQTNLTLIAIATLISGTILGYTSKAWRWIFWSVRIPLDVMQILIQENTNKKGRNVKFSEDKVDILNPTQDSGKLMNLSWIISYNISQGNKESSSFSFFGGDSSEFTYALSSLRIYRKKILKIIEDSMLERSVGRTNRIFIVNSSSVYYVGEINEEFMDIPKVIEDKLDHQRKSRLNIFLHGPIGTGKTTLARAIAQKLGMPIYILAISAWWDITDFVKGLQRIPDDSVILFDDIDLILEQLLRVSIDKNTAPIPLKFSTASIMAFLDGIFMKEKRWIVIMCTNRPEQVRKLLRLRPGRVHIDFECNKVHVTDYIEAAQEADKIIEKFREEKKAEKAEAEPTVEVEAS